MLKFQKRNSKYYTTLLIQTLNSFDLFGQVPVFKILKQNKFTTKTGFLFTLSIIIACSIYLGISLEEVFMQSNPSVVVNEQQTLNSDPILLSHTNFTFAVTVTNISYSSLRTLNSYFTIKVQNCIRSRKFNEATRVSDISYNCQFYDIESCTREKHFVTSTQQDYFKEFNLDNIYCISADQQAQRPLFLQGTVTGDNYSYINVIVDMCKNTTESQNCAPIELINKQLSIGYYAVYMSDSLIQMDRPGRPFQDIISLAYTSFSNANSKLLYTTLRSTNSQTDQGLIQKDQIDDYGLVQVSMRDTQEYYNNQFMIYHTIFMDFRTTYYRRTYQKLQQVLGLVGGLWQVLYFVVGILIGPFVRVMMNLEMANRLFQFKSETGAMDYKNINLNDFDEIKSKQCIAEVNAEGKDSVPQCSQFNNSFRQEDYSKHNHNKFSIFRRNILPEVHTQEQINTYIKSRKKALELGCLQIMLIIFGFRKKEIKQLNYATYKIMSKLDVAFIISKLFEIDKLKRVLLTTDQQKLFNYLPKPVIPDSIFAVNMQESIRELETKPQYQYILEEEKSDLMKLTAAHQAYQIISQSENQSIIDKQLLKQIEDDILELFQRIKDNNSGLNHGQIQISPIEDGLSIINKLVVQSINQD